MSSSLRPFVCSLVLLALAVCHPVSAQGELKVGYATVRETAAGEPAPFGTALFTFEDSNGVLVSQAGVGAVHPIPAGRVFVDQVGTKTAIALVNTGPTAATLDLVLRDASGQPVGEKAQRFEAGQHLPLFVHELFDGLQEGFLGSVSFGSEDGDARWAAVTLRQSFNQRQEPIFATLPVVSDSDALGTDSLLFPQVGAGPGLSTQILLLNRTDGPAQGRIHLSDSAGMPLELESGATRASEFSYSLPAFGVVRMQLTRSDGQTGVGYAVVTADQGATPAGTALFQFTSGDAVVSEAGVGAAPLVSRARMFVDNAGTRTGVALASPGNSAANFTFRLLDRQQRSINTKTRNLQANGHLAVFADEIFTEVSDGFTGMLEVEADIAFAPVTLKLTVNARGELIVTTLPVVDLDQPPEQGPVYFPQIGFGLGFSTRLILLNGDLETSNVGRLSFFSSDGSDLVVPIAGQNASASDFSLGPGAARQFFPGVTAQAAEILVRTSELTINQGSTRPLRPIVLDELGNARDDLPLSFQSLAPETVQIDQGGNMTALNRGFSTIVVTSGDVLRRFTVTSATITGGVTGVAPSDVAQDFAGKIFLANSTGHTVLQTDDLEQAASLYAGAPGEPGLVDGLRLQARFQAPASLAIDQSPGGGIFVSDTLNHLIRIIRSGSNGDVTTLAGTGEAGNQDGSALEAQFRAPEGVTLDDRGFLWVADTGNQTIRRIDLAKGEVHTVAGRPGSPGDADGTGEEARFNGPKDLAFEAETLAQQLAREATGAAPPPASVLVADSGNGLIRRVWEDGRVETLSALNVLPSASKRSPVRAQRASAVRFDSPSGLVLDPFGNLFVSEEDSGLVKVLLHTGEIALAAEPATFESPGGLTTTIRGRILVAESRRTVQQIRYAGPTIFSVEPGTIPAQPGQSVMVLGRNFAPESIVVIGDVVVDAVTFKNSTEISFVSPALPSGRQTLTVQHRGGQAQTQIDILPLAVEDLAPGDITTVAGGTSNVGDGLQATSSVLSEPTGLAVSKSGDLYISDASQHRVRRVSPISGVIQTAVGSGHSGSDSAPGLALLFDLESPSRLAVDPTDTLFVADALRHQVFAYRPALGTVEVVAGTGEAGFSGDGGEARLARLNAPSGVAIDEEGNLWISDTGNQRIRKIDRRSGIIETMAGTGAQGFSGDHGEASHAELNTPLGLAFRADGGLLIADSGNHRIRVLRPDATIESVAGDGVADFHGDGGSAKAAALKAPLDVAVDANDTVYIADSGNHRIRRIIGGIITTLGGTGAATWGGDGGSASAASFNHPTALAVDGSGYLLVADTGNRRVRRILLSDRTVSTVAGSDGDFGGDGGPAWRAALADPAGLAIDQNRLLIVERGAHRMRGLAGGSTTATDRNAPIDTVAGTGLPGDSEGPSLPLEALLLNPTDVAIGPQGVVIFSDTGNHRLRQFGGGTISTLAGTGSPGFLDDVPGSIAPLNGPTGVTVDASGSVIWADTLNHRIRQLRFGYVSVVAGTGVEGFSGEGDRPTTARLSEPRGVFATGDGRLFVSDTKNHRVRLITQQPDRIVTIAGNGDAGFSGDGGAATEASLHSPTGLFIDDTSHLFIADTGNHRIRMVDLATGRIETVAGIGEAGFSGDGGPATAAMLQSPWGVIVDNEGNLFVTDSGNHRVRVIRAVAVQTDP